MSAGKITAEQVKYVAQLARLRLSDDEERKLSVIWLAEVTHERLRCWRLLEDTPDRRRAFGFALTA